MAHLLESAKRVHVLSSKTQERRCQMFYRSRKNSKMMGVIQYLSYLSTIAPLMTSNGVNYKSFADVRLRQTCV